jgi:hypothetical protein
MARGEMGMKQQKPKTNFKVTIKLKTLDKMTGQELEAYILDLIKHYFESGRIKAE